MPFRSTKTYGHDIGLSACFRQWRAEHSHCRFLHGYALSVHLEFEAKILDERNWVVDFGGMKGFKEELQNLLDHKTVVAGDDPDLDFFKLGHERGIMDVIVLPHDGVGCELFAKRIFRMAQHWLRKNELSHRVSVALVEVREHGGNSAKYMETY